MFNDRAYHDTYYVVAHGHWLASLALATLLVVAVIVAVHRLTPGPRLRQLARLAGAGYLLGFVLTLLHVAVAWWLLDPRIFLEAPHWLGWINRISTVAGVIMSLAIGLCLAILLSAVWHRFTRPKT